MLCFLKWQKWCRTQKLCLHPEAHTLIQNNPLPGWGCEPRSGWNLFLIFRFWTHRDPCRRVCWAPHLTLNSLPSGHPSEKFLYFLRISFSFKQLQIAVVGNVSLTMTFLYVHRCAASAVFSYGGVRCQTRHIQGNIIDLLAVGIILLIAVVVFTLAKGFRIVL